MVTPIVKERRPAAIGQPGMNTRVEPQLLLMGAPGLGLPALPLVLRLRLGLAGVLLSALGRVGLREKRDPRAVGAPSRLSGALAHMCQPAGLAAVDADDVNLRLIAFGSR